jgi:CubicO group peptidase (beta-lactamase class C family)
MDRIKSLVAAAVVLTALQAGVAQAQVAATAPSDELVQAGMAGDRLARIGPAMKQQVQKDIFPGAVTLVARDGKIVHFESHGFLDAAKTKPMTRDAVFRLASMTKPIVTVAAMMLVEQGAMKLNDPIANWLPELKDVKVETATGDVAPSRPVTVQDLMRHTSGLVYSGSTRSPRIKEKYQEANIESSVTDITGDEMLKRLGQIPLAHQPGTYWEYGISVDVLGLLIERVAAKPLDDLLDGMLFRPLGMTETAFWARPELQSRLAETLDNDPQKATMDKAYRIMQDPSGKSYFKGGAGLVGTATDYLKFAQMMVNGGHFEGKRYLSRKTVEFMLSDHTVGMGGTTQATTGPGYGFGLGFGVRVHEGYAWVPGSKGDAMWAGAWGTSFWIDPKERLVGILMAQGPSHRIHTRMLYKNLVYGALVE